MPVEVVSPEGSEPWGSGRRLKYLANLERRCAEAKEKSREAAKDVPSETAMDGPSEAVLANLQKLIKETEEERRKDQ